MIPCKPHRRIDQADKGTLKMTQSFILYTVFYENGTDYFLFSGQIPASPPPPFATFRKSSKKN